MRPGVDTEFFITPPVNREKLLESVRDIVESEKVVDVHYHVEDEPCNDNCMTVQKEGIGSDARRHSKRDERQR